MIPLLRGMNRYCSLASEFWYIKYLRQKQRSEDVELDVWVVVHSPNTFPAFENSIIAVTPGVFAHISTGAFSVCIYMVCSNLRWSSSVSSQNTRQVCQHFLSSIMIKGTSRISCVCIYTYKSRCTTILSEIEHIYHYQTGFPPKSMIYFIVIFLYKNIQARIKLILVSHVHLVHLKAAS